MLEKRALYQKEIDIRSVHAKLCALGAMTQYIVMNENIFSDDCQLGIHHLYRDTLDEFKFLIMEAPYEQ